MNSYKWIATAFIVFVIYISNFQNHIYAQYNGGSFPTGTTITGIKVVTEDLTLLPDLGNSKPASQVSSSSKNKDIGKLTPNYNNTSPASTNNSFKLLYNSSTFFSQETLCGYFTSTIRNAVFDSIKAIIYSIIKQKLPRGFGLHSQSNIQMGNDCNANVKLISSNTPMAVIEFTIPKIRSFMRITTPDGIPGSLDPNFAMLFDLVFRFPIFLPTSTSQVNNSFLKGDLSIEVINISKPETKSVTGNLIIAVNNIISYFGGPDFISTIRSNKGFHYAFGGVRTRDYFPGIKQLFAGLPVMRIDNYTERNVLVMKATNREIRKPMLH